MAKRYILDPYIYTVGVVKSVGQVPHQSPLYVRCFVCKLNLLAYNFSYSSDLPQGELEMPLHVDLHIVAINSTLAFCEC